MTVDNEGKLPFFVRNDIHPDDLVSVEPAERNGWNVVLWGIDGDRLTIVRYSQTNKVEAQMFAAKMRRLIISWG